MVPFQQLQNIINGFKAISKVDFSLYDIASKCIVTTLKLEPDFEDVVFQFITSKAEDMEAVGKHLFKVVDGEKLEYVLVLNETGEKAYVVGRMATFQLNNLVQSYEEKYDKDDFVKNLLLDNLLLIDIHNGSQKLNIKHDLRRVVLIIESINSDGSQIIDKVKSYEMLDDCFVTAVDETNVVCVKEVNLDNDILTKEIRGLRKILDDEGYKECKLACGTVVNELKEVSRSYKEAKMALDVGKIFMEEKNLIAYSKLGIGRIIFQLPIPLCRIFIKEIFGEKSIEDFDSDISETIEKFFENSLNVSETSRQLFIHRNTLVYRLDKIQKMTNLDIRVFEDAITFKIAMMVVKYMKYMENH